MYWLKRKEENFKFQNSGDKFKKFLNFKGIYVLSGKRSFGNI